MTDQNQGNDANDPAKTGDKNLQYELDKAITERNDLKAKYDTLNLAYQKLKDHVDSINRGKLMSKLKSVELLARFFENV